MCQAVDTGWLTCISKHLGWKLLSHFKGWKTEGQTGHLTKSTVSSGGAALGSIPKINSLKHLKQYFGAPIICVWGHNDGTTTFAFMKSVGATVEPDFTEEITAQGLMKAEEVWMRSNSRTQPWLEITGGLPERNRFKMKPEPTKVYEKTCNNTNYQGNTIQNCNETLPTPARMAFIKMTRNKAIEDEEKGENWCIVGGNVIWCSHYGKQHRDVSKN